MIEKSTLALDYDKSVVRIGCTVCLDMDNEHTEFIIVPAMGDYSLGILSTESVLGKALLGRKAGDTVSINKDFFAKIVSIV